MDFIIEWMRRGLLPLAEAFAAFAATAIDKAHYLAELQRAREEAEAATRAKRSWNDSPGIR